MQSDEFGYIIDIGKPYQHGNQQDGAWFLSVAVLNTDDFTDSAMREYGAEVCKNGAITAYSYRANTLTELEFAQNIVKQVLHLTGHSRHSEAFVLSRLFDLEIDLLYGIKRTEARKENPELMNDVEKMMVRRRSML